MGLSGPVPMADYQRKVDRRPSRKTDSTKTNPNISVPDKPSWLVDEASLCWDRTIKHLIALETPLAKADEDSIAAYCMNWAQWRQLADEYLNCDKLARDFAHGGTKKSPLFVQYKELGKEVRAWQIELGMTPKARQRIARAVTPDDSDDDSDLD